MTEIKIEKKKPVWPWILLVLGLLVAAWFFFFRNDKDELVETADKSALIDIHENNNLVATYVTFINANTNTMNIDHAFTSEAISKLTNAVDALATEVGYDVKVDIAKAFLNDEGENHLIIPIGMVTLDEDNKKVHTNQIDYNTFAKTKRFKKGVDIEKSYELIVLPHYFPGDLFDEEKSSENHFYNRKQFI